ncbi:MAG: HAD family hydrolase [Bifidobacterium sp.]|jgi:hydroxymethylpyrimidine pyrophosphatase-like HAD family hydrolase|nr:HAD family hydrolase [Bifidobacterium sp.]
MRIFHAQPHLIVADLDGTLLHDAPTFEDRFMTERSVRAIEKLHARGLRFAISTARPVSTSIQFAQRLPVDACIYLNGALVDVHPSSSTYDMLTSGVLPDDGHLIKVGFPSSRACEVCLHLLSRMPDLKLGIVMDDVRYTNFDVSVYWKTQTYRITDFSDVPDGIADKLIIFPTPQQTTRLRALIPADFDVSVSEGSLWMLMNPKANKVASLHTLCSRMRIPMESTVSFGDDLIDIGMLTVSGRGVAVANARPEVLDAADEICPSNNDDGVAQWIERLLE